MNWASDKPQNSTVPCLGSRTPPGEERGLLTHAGSESDVSRWEPADDRVPRRLVFVSSPQSGRNMGHCSRAGREPLELGEQMPFLSTKVSWQKSLIFNAARIGMRPQNNLGIYF